MNMTFSDIAATAGYHPGSDGKLNLPAMQKVADALAVAAITMLPDWQPGMEAMETVTLTGAGPVWGYLCIAHALHGRVPKLVYAAPNAAAITVFNHGG